MIKDDEDKISFLLFDALFDDVENNKQHKFKKLRVKKFINKPLPKSAKTSTALAIENPGIQATR